MEGNEPPEHVHAHPSPHPLSSPLPWPQLLYRPPLPTDGPGTRPGKAVAPSRACTLGRCTVMSAGAPGGEGWTGLTSTEEAAAVARGEGQTMTHN